MDRVFISLGSNLGDRVLNCRKAIERLKGAEGVTLVRESSFYETEPWGSVVQGSFINCAVEITTTHKPQDLLDLLKRIELDIGRTPSPRQGPRQIDLDIIFYGDTVVGEKGLTIPHPRLHQRAFVLVPLAEIAPGFIHPVLEKSVSELAMGVKGGVTRLENR
jgi:2-amino-4-hydroxy-6-hydroxymethyldihydropteridine diphosphokinase